jgi:hypothetical protein
MAHILARYDHPPVSPLPTMMLIGPQHLLRYA